MFSVTAIARPILPTVLKPLDDNPLKNAGGIRQLSAATSSTEVRKSPSPTNEEVAGNVCESDFYDTFISGSSAVSAATDTGVSAPSANTPADEINSLKLEVDLLSRALNELCRLNREVVPTKAQTHYENSLMGGIPQLTALSNLKADLTELVRQKTNATEKPDLGSINPLENAQVAISQLVAWLKECGADADPDYVNAFNNFQKSKDAQAPELGITLILRSELRKLLPRQIINGTSMQPLPSSKDPLESSASIKGSDELQDNMVAKARAKTESLMYEIKSNPRSKEMKIRGFDMLEELIEDAMKSVGSELAFYWKLNPELEDMKAMLKDTSPTRSTFKILNKKTDNKLLDDIKIGIQHNLQKVIGKIAARPAVPAFPIRGEGRNVARKPEADPFVPLAASKIDALPDQQKDESKDIFAAVQKRAGRPPIATPRTSIIPKKLG